MLCRISVNVHTAEMKEKMEMTKEGNLNNNRGKSPKVKSPYSTSAELEGVGQLPDKLKLKPSSKNISTEPNQEVKGDNKQKELAPQTGKEQAFQSKPKPGKKAEEKSELKCKPVTSQNSSVKEPTKDLGAEVKIHQDAAKAEESLKDAGSEKRESESASSGGNGGGAHQHAGAAPETTESREASKELPSQGETVIGKLLAVTHGNYYIETFVLPVCVLYSIRIYTKYTITVGILHSRPPVSYSSGALISMPWVPFTM